MPNVSTDFFNSIDQKIQNVLKETADRKTLNQRIVSTLTRNIRESLNIPRLSAEIPTSENHNIQRLCSLGKKILDGSEGAWSTQNVVGAVIFVQLVYSRVYPKECDNVTKFNDINDLLGSLKIISLTGVGYSAWWVLWACGILLSLKFTRFASEEENENEGKVPAEIRRSAGVFGLVAVLLAFWPSLRLLSQKELYTANPVIDVVVTPIGAYAVLLACVVFLISAFLRREMLEVVGLIGGLVGTIGTGVLVNVSYFNVRQIIGADATIGNIFIIAAAVFLIMLYVTVALVTRARRVRGPKSAP